MYNKDIAGKRLLLIGGVDSAFDLINLARRNGVFVGVTDYNSDTSVKKIADAAYSVSATDVDAVVRLYKDEKYEGVISNFVDMLSPYVTKIAERVGAYVPYTEEQLKMSTDKSYFKKMCIKYGVDVPKEFKVELDDFKSIDKIEFPVIVKPVDGSGSKGITICYSKEDFTRGYENAVNTSKSGRAIVEQYLPYDEINVTYIAQDGDIQLAAIHDRYFNTEQDNVVRVPDMYIYPSRYTDLFARKYNNAVIEMLKAIGIKNGSLFMQACVKDEVVYFYEAGMRLNGCKTYDILEVENDFNTLERLIRFALVGDMGKRCTFTPRLKRWYATWNIVAKPGVTIKEYRGIEELNSYPWIIATHIRYKEGERVPANSKGTLIQLLGRFHLWAETKEQLIERIGIMQSLFKAIGTNGEDALLTPHDVSDLDVKINYGLDSFKEG